MKDLMFLGFRHKRHDFLYEGEWQTFSSWLAVHAAFSRDDPDRKVYVQDMIEENGAHVCALLDAGARIYVCGRSHPMPSQVFDAFAEVLHIHRGLTLELAAERLREMQRAQRYICDTWG
jgi:sulfite reductase alpha subunit-like flavoprotein